MRVYERPQVEDLGSVADLTQALGLGPGSDSTWPILSEADKFFPGVEDFLTHS